MAVAITRRGAGELAYNKTSFRRKTHSLRRFSPQGPTRGNPLVCRSSSAVYGKYVLLNGVVDYYEVLGVDDDATPDEIKRAYRALAKECHPDYLGDRGHDICILLNEAYETLSDAAARDSYNVKLEAALDDDEDDYTGEPLSKWTPAIRPAMAKHSDPEESRAVFVDECSCIGCKACIWAAPATFRIEQEYGRSRVFGQWLDTEDSLQTAIDACPVNCIHWVQRSDLPALEYVVQRRLGRPNVAVVMSGQGGVPDVFSATQSFMKERRRKVEAQQRANAQKATPAQEEARRRAADELRKQHLGFFSGFTDLFGAAVDGMSAVVNGNTADSPRVGQRKRRVRWDAREEREAAGELQGSAEVFIAPIGYSVPRERALVPLGVYSRASGN